MKTSNLYSLNLADLSKGLVIAIGGAIIASIQNVLQAGSISLNWKSIGITALAAGVSYLAKNFFTPAQIVHNAHPNG